MQPVQDLTIEDRVSRTQFQFTLEDPDAEPSRRVGAEAGRAAAASCPQLADVASDLQDRGLQAFLDIDRDAASRLGVRVAAIDDALYDAFGQRLISTIYTQANQYRVVLEVAPRFQIGPEALGHVLRGHRRRQARCRSPASPRSSSRTPQLVDQPRRAISRR